MKLVVGKIEGRKHTALMLERLDEPEKLRVLAYFVSEKAADLFVEALSMINTVSSEKQSD